MASCLARLHRATVLRRTKVVAVIGSFGKTTTTCATCTAVGLPIHERTRRGRNCCAYVPLRLLQHPPWRRIAVIEVGIGSPRQMQRYADTLKPDIVVVTALGLEHVSAFADAEHLYAEKAKMVESLSHGGWAILNRDDENVMKMARRTDAKVLTFGFNQDADIIGTRMKFDWSHGTELEIEIAGERLNVRTHLLGRHMMYPLLAAFAVARACGISAQGAANRLELLEPVPGRLHPVTLPNGAILLCDDFKATPETAHSALEVLALLPAERRIAVIGELENMDGSRYPVYRDLGCRIAQAADRALLLGHGSNGFRCIRTGMRQGGMSDGQFERISDVPHAVEHLRRVLRRGDVVLLKGRMPQKLVRIAFALQGHTVRCNRDRCTLGPMPCHACALL